LGAPQSESVVQLVRSQTLPLQAKLLGQLGDEGRQAGGPHNPPAHDSPSAQSPSA
jgi:hypothetical protein